MQPSAVLSAEERLLAWPDSYYNESEPQLRREMLDLAIGKGLSPEEDRIRDELFRIRYPEYGLTKAEMTKDVYLMSWISIRLVGNEVSGPFSRRGHIRKVRKALEDMGFGKMKQYGQKGEDLLYLELKHLGTLYFHLCREDKQYGSVILGIGRLSSESLAGKAAAEAYLIAYDVPERLGLSEECALWTRAVRDAYEAVFPDSGELDARTGD